MDTNTPWPPRSDSIQTEAPSTLMSSPTATATSRDRPTLRESRLCWICQQDETEDESPNTKWKAPCPCSLTAHESCLLEWITAQEFPRPGIQFYNKPIRCPQCQSVIQVERPHDYIVQAYNALYSGVRSLVIPTAFSGVLGCVYSGFLVYGFNTMEVVFGSREARLILSGQVFDYSLGAEWFDLLQKTLRWSLTVFDPFFPPVQTSSDWKIFVGLPLIGPALVLARTRYAEQAFPLLLPLYFLDPSHRRVALYPPLTPGFAFATLPYISATYNNIYRQLITPHETRWEAAVQRRPREGETAADVAAQAQEDEGDGAMIEIQIVEEVEEMEGDDAVNLGEEAQVAAGNIAQQAGADAEPIVVNGNLPLAGQGQQVEGGQLPEGQVPAENANGGWQIRQDYPLRGILASTTGALAFPTVASYAGEILYYALPAHLVVKRASSQPIGWTNGLLREKWGRTIVGGCLFVLLKDAITLYVKWKRAKDFGKRNILDYKGPRKGAAS